MTVAKRPSAGVVCPGSGRQPKVFQFKPTKSWAFEATGERELSPEEIPDHLDIETCPVCTRVFNVTRRGLVPRHLTR